MNASPTPPATTTDAAAPRPVDPSSVTPPGGDAAPTDVTAHPAPDAAGSSDQAPDEPTATRFVFVDTEATGLDHNRHELTEVAWIVRFEDGTESERQYFPEHTTDGADEDALLLTHYHDRIAPQTKTPMKEWLGQFLEDAEGAVLVGAVPDFDSQHLAQACRKMQWEPTWDHHLLDVETLALPLIAPGPETPRSLAKTCRALGLTHDRDQAHGALYDAYQAKAVFDRVWEVYADLRERSAPLPDAIPRNANANDNTSGNGQPGSGSNHVM